MSPTATIVIRGTVIEVGRDPSNAADTTAFVRLARNNGDIVVGGLTHDEARTIASSYFGEVISITITRSDQ